jgi:hypothetical protein
MRRAAALAGTLLALAACSPKAPAPDNAQEVRAEANVAPAAALAQAETAAAPAPAEATAPTAAAAAGERRCGWLSNPTPGNYWLTDKDGQWILATQGGDQAPGMDDMPDMSTAGWVETNVHYGYGCACITIAHDPATRAVTRIAKAEPKPLKQCRADRSLPKPG